MYIFKKTVLHLYIKYIYIWYNLYEYKYIHFKIYAVCVSLFIHNKYTKYKHTVYYVNNFWVRLIVWQHLATLSIFTLPYENSSKQSELTAGIEWISFWKNRLSESFKNHS